MIQALRVPVVLSLALAVQAQGTLQVSIGIRETGASAGAFTAIGGNGGSTGGIEWVNRDAQTVILDGVWRQYTWNITTDPLIAFAGTTANATLDGTFGTLEHVRILNNTGITDPITLWIDDVTNTTMTGGPVNFGDFQTYPAATEVMFQEPLFSGSTAANLLPGATGGVSNLVAARTSSDRFDFQFVDGTTTRWVRLTTFNATNQANPLIRFDDQSVVTFWMRGGKSQESVGSQGPGTAIAEICGTGLNTGQMSAFYGGGAPALAIGVIGVSIVGAPDLPLFGGNIVGGTSLLFTVPIFADAAGRASLPLNGIAGPFDLLMQSAFLDPSLPQTIAFTNALRARYGQ